MNGIFSRCAGAAILLGLASCQTTAVETAPVSQTLEPMAYKPYAEGEVLRWQDGGDVSETEVLEVSGDVVTLQDSEGCKWTTVAGGFAPSTKWSNCDGSSGTQEVTREGNIFPLTVGATETWRATGSDTRGYSWDDAERVCTVTETARVTVPAGTFDTYHVRCEDPWRVRNWYIASELGRPVLYTRSHKRRAESERQELIAVEAPAA